MIYTVTLNPSLDYFVSVHEFTIGKTNRTFEEQMLPGGKGLNVSMVLKNLGQNSTALGFTAGFVGQEITSRIREMGVCAELISLQEGNSRINIKFKNMEGTEINGMGPAVSQEDMDKLMTMIKEFKPGDYLVLAGSIPSSVPNSIYKDIISMIEGKGIKVVVDAAGELLKQVLPYKPFLVKPNKHELEELFDVELSSRREIISHAKKLQEAGAGNVLVSMASDGAVLAAENGQIFEMDAPKGICVNGVGAGDSMVAGFLCGWLESADYETAFRMGVCTGSASAFSERFATRQDVESLLEKSKNL